MKRRFLVLFLALVLTVSAFCGCVKEEKNKQVSVKIGIAAPDATHGWVAGVAYYAEKYCKDKKIDYKLTVSSNAEEMTKKLDELVEWGAEAIVMWPQWTDMESAVSKIIAKGIPVVSFDIDIACDGIYKVTGNNYDMGYRSAQYIVERVGDNATIAVLEVPSSGSVSELRKKGFYEYLEKINYDKSNIFEVSEAAFGRDCGYEDMKTILENHSTIDAVFSMDDENSIGIVRACVEAGRTDIKAITGGGGMQEYFKMIKSGEYDSYGLASALYSPKMIEEAIDTAISLKKGKECESEIVIPTDIVTKKNVDKHIDENNKVY